jgi:non-ribosomal peptide synthetase component F
MHPATPEPFHPQGPLIPSSFAACVASRPNAPCLVAEDGSSLSFTEVDAAATSLARRLVARGVGKDKAVGILFDRQPAVVVSMIAVHKVRLEGRDSSGTAAHGETLNPKP